LEYAKKLKLMESWVPRKDDVTWLSYHFLAVFCIVNNYHMNSVANIKYGYNWGMLKSWN
jgi:hypothetical protein